MKIKLIAILVTAVLSLAVSNLQAQVTTNTVPFGTNTLTQQNFLVNLASWVATRYSSGETWPSNTTDIEVGADYASQSSWANYVAITKNLGSFYVGAQMDNAGVAGVVNQLGGRAGYVLSNGGDLKVEAGIYGGYQLHNAGDVPSGMFVEPELGAVKLITGPTAANPTEAVTFASAWIYYPLRLHGTPSTTPGFKIGAGFSF
jgi:hypothetical protein